MQILASIALLVIVVCWVMTLIKIFQDKEKNGVLHGVLGILFCLWAFIWGWINTGRFGNKQIMLIWTVALVVYFVAGGASMASAMSDLQAG
jgi:hypothetical protein